MQTNLELEEAVRLLTNQITPLGTQSLPLRSALGRTLAADLDAPLHQPPFNRSPLDGYALRAADSAGAAPEHPVFLKVTDTVYAGAIAAVPIRPGQAARVMTGAMLPDGCDCVLRQEDTDMGFPLVSIRRALRPFENYCGMGEDFSAGSTLLPAGTRLDAAAVGLLASAGFCEVPVRRRPQVLVLATGDELVRPRPSSLPPGKIYDANLALLSARLDELGVTASGGELIHDDALAVAGAMARLLESCDFLITTGGISVGERDVLHQALPLLKAERVFWRLKLKPGAPALFSRHQGKPILSLSGNPAAAAVTFELLARPLLAALSGEARLLPRSVSGVLANSFPKPSSTRRFLRGRYENGKISLPEHHAAGVLSSLVGCNCLADIPAGSGPLKTGDAVRALLL